MKNLKSLKPWAWLVGDVLALFAFVYIGQRDHDLVEAANPVWGALKPTLMFGLPWIAVGVWLKAFRLDEAGVRAFFARSLNAWLVAALLGVLVRSYILGRAVIPTSFLAATLFFGGLFVLDWRGLWVLGCYLTQRRAARHSVKNDSSISPT